MKLFFQLAFRVIRRSDNQLLPVMFEADPTFCFHFVNCYEVEEHLVVDLCGYDDIGVFDALYLKDDKNELNKPKIPSGTFRRYVLPINVTEVCPRLTGNNVLNVLDIFKSLKIICLKKKKKLVMTEF